MFHGIVGSSAAATQELLNLNPSNMGITPGQLTRPVAQADLWAHYRILSMRFRFMTSGASTPVAAAFVGGVQDTPPSTLAQVMEVIPAVLLGANQQVPTNWVDVPRSDLAGPLPWYKSLLGAGDATEESPGVLVIFHTTLVSFLLELFIEYEFKVAVAPANTPEGLALLQEVRALRVNRERQVQRAQVLRALTGPSTNSTTPGDAALPPSRSERRP